jgi:hypothetical protein
MNTLSKAKVKEISVSGNISNTGVLLISEVGKDGH